MIIDHGVPFRPDWENVITPVVDFLLARPDVDPERIALIGLSFGGYLAPRAATAEHRLAACISDCGPYDLFDATARRLPGFLARQLPDGNPALLRLLDRLVRAVMNKPTAGWAMRRNLMVHGLSDPLEYFRIAPQYSLKGLEQLHQLPDLRLLSRRRRPQRRRPEALRRADLPQAVRASSRPRKAPGSTARAAPAPCSTSAPSTGSARYSTRHASQARGAVPPSCGPPTQHRHSPCTPPRERRNSHVFATPARRHRSPSPALHRRT